jgi:uncharacterized membrane protein YbhN (UPF0104 family)
MKTLEMPRHSHTGLTIPSPQRWIHWLLKLLLSILLLGLLLRLVEPASFWATIRAIDIRLLVVGMILFFPGQLLAAYRWYFVLKRLQQPQPFWSVVRYTMLGQLAALFLPGRISGDVARTIAIAHRQRDKATYALSVMIDKTALLIAMATFALLGGIGSRPVSRFGAVHVAALILALVALLMLLVLCRYRSGPVLHWLNRCDNRVCFLHRYALGLARWLTLPRLSLHTIFIILGLGFGLQCSYTIGSYIMARSMHIMIDPIDWATINAIVALGQILPLTVSGLGIREGLFAQILALYQVPVSQSTAFSLAGFVVVTCLVVLSWVILESVSFRRP